MGRLSRRSATARHCAATGPRNFRMPRRCRSTCSTRASGWLLLASTWRRATAALVTETTEGMDRFVRGFFIALTRDCTTISRPPASTGCSSRDASRGPKTCSPPGGDAGECERFTTYPFGEPFAERKGDNRWSLTLAIPTGAFPPCADGLERPRSPDEPLQVRRQTLTPHFPVVGSPCGRRTPTSTAPSFRKVTFEKNSKDQNNTEPMNNRVFLAQRRRTDRRIGARDIIHRYEKILTRVYENEYEGVQYVADNYRQGDPHVQRTPLLERGLRRVAALRAGPHDGAHPAGSLPRIGEAPRGGADQLPQRRGVQPRRVLPDQIDRTAEPQLPHPRGVPQPHRHPAENVHIPDGTMPEDKVRSTARRTTIRCAAST